LLGFSAPHHNVFHASNARGKNEAVLLAACGQLMLSLSRMAEDLILFSMPEFGYFTLPPELCTGSSIMPQKNNPDVLELIRAKAAVVLGYGSAANMILKALPGGYNRDLQETKALYMEGLTVTRAALRIMRLMVGTLTVRPERLRAGFTPDVFATDRALELVAGGMPFRDAYQHVRSHLETLQEADPDRALAAKTHLGATAGLDFGGYRARVRDVRRWVRVRRTRLRAIFSALLGGAADALG
jgi:argininosuccinate lyase